MLDPFTFTVRELETVDGYVRAPEGVVYSTSPKRATGDALSFFVKGPEVAMIFAEVAGCVLASETGLPIPPVALCRFVGELYAGSIGVEGAMRDVLPWLRRWRHIVNLSALFDLVVVDTWLANTDRNLGNVIGSPVSGSDIELVFIDFEKSKALHPNPTVESTMVTPRQLWPRGELGNLLSQHKPHRAPAGITATIANLSGRVERLIRPIADEIGGVQWLEDSAFALERRASRIRELAEEVWQST